ncbi:MAG TPA: hypothetical protein DCQ53_06865 [Alphaproteobacteria bacterium]|jgi:hypothetical protein|nr:hypothetical protein [Alphaproteobacteria bacterium]
MTQNQTQNPGRNQQPDQNHQTRSENQNRQTTGQAQQDQNQTRAQGGIQQDPTTIRQGDQSRRDIEQPDGERNRTQEPPR